VAIVPGGVWVLTAPDGGELVVLDARTLPAGAGSGQEPAEDPERLAGAAAPAWWGLLLFVYVAGECPSL